MGDQHINRPPPAMETIFGIEKTYCNLLFFKAIAFCILLQPVLFYGTWLLFPRLSKDRRGLGWVLSMYCSIAFLALALMEVEYVRTTVFERLGLDAVSLGLPNPEGATVFSTWMPSFNAWVQGLPSLPVDAGTTATSFLSAGRFDVLYPLAGTMLQWFITLPIFSLTPLGPTQQVNPNALSVYLGGGGRLLFSLDQYPHESVFGALGVGNFVGFCVGDLVLGSLHYREHLDPLSGWVHHIASSVLAYRMAVGKALSVFAICGGLLEFSTIFLSVGFVFPRLRSDFWFPVSFVLSRIFCNFFLWHEVFFNYSTPSGAAGVYAMSFLMHVFWLQKYFQGQRRRAQRKSTNAGTTMVERDGKGIHCPSSTVLATATSNASRTIHLRVKDEA
ncbi:MAG: hypothetical protein J3Q66DRAFT_435053 [Benniella sp.]|nr:MAG: hypothetical protein J3Q66DRAFT_435053 [Benniella sp.]